MHQNLVLAPLFIESRRPSINIVPPVIARLRFAQNDSHQVAGTIAVITPLHFGGNFVVGLGNDLGKLGPLGIVTQGREGIDACHR